MRLGAKFTLVALMLAAPVAGLVLAAPARGGTFPVGACDDAGDRATHAWTEHRTAPVDQLEVTTDCPSGVPDPYGSLRNGLAVGDVINAWDEGLPDASYAEWRFTAPAGTAVVGASITRDIGNRDEWTPYGRIDGVDQPGESCMRGMDQSFCRIQGTRVFSALDATTVAYGVRCVVAPYCAHGATLRTVWVLVLGATVTLEDRQAPTVSAVDSDGVADGRWWNRVGTVSFSASDNTGVRRRRVLVDGVPRASVDAPGASAGGCGEVGAGAAYSYARPCADSRGLNGTRSVSVDPCGWGDGVHAVRATAVDTGGLEAIGAGSATVRVDCAAPVVSLHSGAEEILEGDDVAPSVSASDGTSGVAGTEVEISVDGASWQEHAGPVVAEAGRTYVFRARAVDLAGNWSGWAVGAEVKGVSPPVTDVPDDESPGDAPGEDPPTSPPTPVVDGGSGEADTGSPSQAVEDVLPEPLAILQQPPPTAPLHRAPARLRITRVVALRRGRIRIAGIAAARLDAPIRVRLRIGRRTVIKRVRAVNGRWRATFGARRGTRVRAVSAATPRTERFKAGTALWRGPRGDRAKPLADHPA